MHGWSGHAAHRIIQTQNVELILSSLEAELFVLYDTCVNAARRASSERGTEWRSPYQHLIHPCVVCQHAIALNPSTGLAVTFLRFKVLLMAAAGAGAGAGAAGAPGPAGRGGGPAGGPPLPPSQAHAQAVALAPQLLEGELQQPGLLQVGPGPIEGDFDPSPGFTAVTVMEHP